MEQQRSEGARYRIRAVSGIKTVYGHDTNDLAEAESEYAFADETYPDSDVELWDRETREVLKGRRPIRDGGSG